MKNMHFIAHSKEHRAAIINRLVELGYPVHNFNDYNENIIVLSYKGVIITVNRIETVPSYSKLYTLDDLYNPEVIEEPEKMTLKEIEEALGKRIEIVE